jgi:hypothetical protein
LESEVAHGRSQCLRHGSRCSRRYLVAIRPASSSFSAFRSSIDHGRHGGNFFRFRKLGKRASDKASTNPFSQAPPFLPPSSISQPNVTILNILSPSQKTYAKLLESSREFCDPSERLAATATCVKASVTRLTSRPSLVDQLETKDHDYRTHHTRAFSSTLLSPESK